MSHLPPSHRTVLLTLVAALAACGGSGSGASQGSSGSGDDTVALSSVSPPASPSVGGAEVAIDGRGFVSGMRVLFGDVEAASVTVESPTHAIVVAPRHAPGPVDLQVKDGRGSAQLPGAFRFDDPPVVKFVDPGHVPQAGGTVIVNGTDFRKGARVLFGADASVGDAQRTSDTQLVAVAGPHAPGAVDVTVVNLDGQRSTFRRDGERRLIALLNGNGEEGGVRRTIRECGEAKGAKPIWDQVGERSNRAGVQPRPIARTTFIMGSPAFPSRMAPIKV